MSVRGVMNHGPLVIGRWDDESELESLSGNAHRSRQDWSLDFELQRWGGSQSGHEWTEMRYRGILFKQKKVIVNDRIHYGAIHSSVQLSLQFFTFHISHACLSQFTDGQGQRARLERGNLGSSCPRQHRYSQDPRQRGQNTSRQ